MQHTECSCTDAPPADAEPGPARAAVYFEPVAAAAELPADASGVGVNPNHCAAGWVSGRM